MYESSIIYLQLKQRHLQLIFTVVPCIMANKISDKNTALTNIF